MQAFRNTVEAILMIIAVAIFCLFLAYVWPDEKYGLAAWVQAVGSIAAIIGAYIVGERQASHARKVALEMQKDSFNQRCKAIVECCKIAVSRAKLVERIFLAGEYDHVKRKSSYTPDLIRSVKTLLDGIHPSELGDYKAITRFLELKNELEYLVQSIEVFDDENARFIGINSNINTPRDVISNVVHRAPLNRAMDGIRHHVDYIKRAFAEIESATRSRAQLQI